MSLRNILEPHIEYIQNLPKDILKSIISYAEEGYDDINLYLNNAAFKAYPSKLVKIEHHIKNIDEAFANSPPLEEPIVVFRGVRSRHSKYYTSKGYMSTSLDITQASMFKAFTEEGRCCVMVITLPVGAKILAIRSVENRKNMDENEILLDRDSQLIIVGYGREENLNIELIYCVYISQNTVSMEILEENEEQKIEKERLELLKNDIALQLSNVHKKHLSQVLEESLELYGLRNTRKLQQEILSRVQKIKNTSNEMEF